MHSVPLTTIVDNEQFIVEKYSVGLMPSLSLTHTRHVDVQDLQVLAMGIDAYEPDYLVLPFIPSPNRFCAS